MAEVGEVEQRDGVALPGGQRRDRGEQPGAQQGVRVVRRGDPVTRRQLRRPPLAAREVAADPAQPRAEGGAVAQGRQGGHRDEDRVLGRVGGAVAGPQQRRVVALDQRAERVAVSLARRGHELGVGHLLVVPRAYPRVTHAAIMDRR
jgi:hypothetical protein